MELRLAISQNKRILIVNSYREPVSRHVSSSFHYLDFHIPEIYSFLKKSEEEMFTMVEKKWIAWLERVNFLNYFILI